MAQETESWSIDSELVEITMEMVPVEDLPSARTKAKRASMPVIVLGRPIDNGKSQTKRKVRGETRKKKTATRRKR